MTDRLDAIRLRLNQLDDQLLKLLSERRELSIEVAKSKVETSKPVRDAKREQQLLVKLINNGKDKYQLDAPYITKIFHTIIEDSVLLQQAYLQNLLNPSESRKPLARVAFLGAKGSYSHLASHQYFSRKNTELIELNCEHFKEVASTVESGHADYGVLPIENTSSGSINEVYDLLQHTTLYIVGELTLPIEHCLVATSDVRLEDIKTLYSHPQPHQQCSEFLSRMKGVALESCVSTADAMQKVKELDRKDVAAIGNASSGKLYGLQPIQGNIANQTENHTRFIVVARKPVEVSTQIPAKTTLIMSTSQKAGSLVESLLVLQRYGINMTKLESRPIMGNPWEEMFYVDLEAHLDSDEMDSAITELIKLTTHLKVLGCYPIENVEATQVSLG
ncbi:P-protein (Includes: Chorismate mutase; Prephenate dehydratase) [Vibrio nigripulchritudo MADA3029]|uniref:Bifunctional chorismate mutase/prephenate dehydratase n=1 Tax=Vibrio nigripulchritudo TaxID=28173 RepID=U4JUP7_9VIBR|nr:prephenate dehydratase [Vibrio nigripulchritudo]EGU61956.1 chorismate mutase/prephenate dehydratase [Vibrio nigripulchritudo ATCC 27043]KJY72406.1 chorismate mutase [Vibrio nigripulchritudo]CCN33567.1 P-protein (Includes: Chorismate mutase; Prephenate dehydratase) [Vibrio nigripulchritudo AM115]CCN40480.1 P-protein (Includes: Chorismate mutase; Prephenate dehydratase) [Vibrio nigripulchritudo FTn2]CCN47987.1 P-protein (Includes: Chorismate mutase; Prephenate dehydratase) [Vibrio nigripulchr